MIKQLFKQIWTQRTLNVWLWLELVIVFVCLSYLVDYLYTVGGIYLRPTGYDIEHVYQVTLDEVSPNSDAYVEDQTEEEMIQHLATALERIRVYPGIESACVTRQSPPYNQRQANGSRCIDTVWVHGRIFHVTPEYFRVFRVTDKQGEISPLVEAAMQEGTIVASEEAEQKFAEKGITMLNSEILNSNYEPSGLTIRAVTTSFRFNEFEEPYPAFYYCQSEFATLEREGADAEIAIRVRADLDTPEFIAAFRNAMKTQLRLGNVYLLDVTSFDEIRTNYFRASGEINRVKTHIAGFAFLLINILLGVIGTFWIRTQQRKSDIALRMVLGARKGIIRFELMGEGIVLLIFAAIPGMILCGNIIYAGLFNIVDDHSFSLERFLIGQLLTVIVMSVMIIAGIYFPSRQAMKIQPAEALHEE